MKISLLLSAIMIALIIPVLCSCGANFSLQTPYGTIAGGKGGTVITPNPEPIVIRSNK